MTFFYINSEIYGLNYSNIKFENLLPIVYKPSRTAASPTAIPIYLKTKLLRFYPLYTNAIDLPLARTLLPAYSIN